MKKLKLISPDDGTTLKKIEGAYVDGSKNLYPIENGVNYLVPKKTYLHLIFLQQTKIIN